MRAETLVKGRRHVEFTVYLTVKVVVYVRFCLLKVYPLNTVLLCLTTLFSFLSKKWNMALLSHL